MRLIVGLGNPGKQYKDTRHNIGFNCIDAFLASENVTTKIDKKFNAEVAIVAIGEDKTVIAKPLTYMNLSGSSVAAIAKYYNILPEDILVVHDDFYLDQGKLRLKRKGSAGGQNGIKDIIDKLKTENFNRLKFGIGLNQKIPVKDYVLGKFTKIETKNLETSVNDAAVVCQLFAEGITINELMNKYN